MKDLDSLIKFYDKVCDLTVNHDVFGGKACVAANKLGAALEEIDQDWWKAK